MERNESCDVFCVQSVELGESLDIKAVGCVYASGFLPGIVFALRRLGDKESGDERMRERPSRQLVPDQYVQATRYVNGSARSSLGLGKIWVSPCATRSTQRPEVHLSSRGYWSQQSW